MKFSVLLPTRNRLELLRYAIQSVRDQAYTQWEIIVSDNFSEEDIRGDIAALHDERIHYFRTPSFISVTSNWNNALEHATGDYVIMLGDDDALMPGFFTTVADLATQYAMPDLLYTDAYLFSYPGVLPQQTQGMLRYGYNTRFQSRQPFLLPHEDAIQIVREALNLQLPIFYNMQLSVIRREFIQSLSARGDFFQSPFPDYYATVVSFLTAGKILVYQQPIAVIGVSKKSFGYYYFNSQEKQGEDFLNNLQEQRQSRLRAVIIPGSTEWTCRLIAMDTVAENYRELLEPFGITVNYAAYRQQQIRFNFLGYYLGEFLSRGDLREAQQAMTRREQWQTGFPLHVVLKLLSIPSKPQRQRLGRLLRKTLKRIRPSMETAWQPTPYTTILDVCKHIEPHLG